MRSRDICDQFFQNKRNFCIFYFFHQFIIIFSRFSEICQLRSKKNSEFANFERNDRINIFSDFLQRKSVEFCNYYDYFFFLIFETFFIFILYSDSFDAFFIETNFYFFVRIDFECGMTFFFDLFVQNFFHYFFIFFRFIFSRNLNDDDKQCDNFNI